uniref:Uncharacterized protein n=1 Tax=Cyclophora tenuis TaxID=216820 RepID=A0A7S1GHB4_CYCTE|mmetsp:Transcript_14328/g.24356  ORF Transcript_14328/g.24356 Transcript_14328/m.24356 type:complete len:177 (+) Transcript_14328:23-553(+)
MGQILKACSDPKGEATKATVLADVTDDNLLKGIPASEGIISNNSSYPPQKQIDDEARREMERERLLREEQSRLDLIISKAGRDMVSVGGTRGTNYYNDQGFAAALAQHLQQTLPPTPIRRELPSPPESKSLYQIMSQPIPIEPAGMDAKAEAFLAEKTIVKEQLFAGCPRIVESLL